MEHVTGAAGLRLGGLVCAALFGGILSAAGAALIVEPTGQPIGRVAPEPGRNAPAGRVAWFDETLAAQDSGAYRFTYAPVDVAELSARHGAGVFLVEFWVGPTREVAEAAGDFFCIRPIRGLCSASAPGASFVIGLGGKAVSYGFVYDQDGYAEPFGLTSAALDSNLESPIVLWPGGFADSLYAWPAYGIVSSAGSVAASPEPDSFLLIGVGLAALFTLGALHLPRPVETPARSGDSLRP